MDGSADGRIKCTLANWTGIAYRIPRTDIELCKDRDHLKQSGVYFLFGVSDESGEPVVYIGQAGERKNGEGILYRLQEHKKNPDKDYWTEAVVFTTAGNTFGPTEISYLENRFCSIAVEAKRYIVKMQMIRPKGMLPKKRKVNSKSLLTMPKLSWVRLGTRSFCQ